MVISNHVKVSAPELYRHSISDGLHHAWTQHIYMKEIDSQVCQGLACFRRKENRDHSEEFTSRFPHREGGGVFRFSFCCSPVFLAGPELEITMCLYWGFISNVLSKVSIRFAPQLDKMAQNCRRQLCLAGWPRYMWDLLEGNSDLGDNPHGL
jgi:hypothetical protein